MARDRPPHSSRRRPSAHSSSSEPSEPELVLCSLVSSAMSCSCSRALLLALACRLGAHALPLLCAQPRGDAC
eukprot:scaffold100717_cov48-Phaeocystis_antarctica.AAC.1